MSESKPPKRKRGRPRSEKGAQEQLLFVRAPQTLLDRLDAHLTRLRARNPQFKVHRSDLVRSLVERALAIEENEAIAEVGVSTPPFVAEPGETTLSVPARLVLEAVRAATADWDLSDLTVPLSRVYSRCRGIARRDYEEGLRTLERFGFITLHRAIDLAALGDQDRLAALLDPRGTLVVAELSPTARQGSPRTRDSSPLSSSAPPNGGAEDSLPQD